MSVQLDETHDPTVTSWLTCANDANSDFLIQNLPFGVFRTRGTKAAARVGVAIGSYVLDVAAIGAGRVFEGAAAAAAAACNAPSVNALMELGRGHCSALRLGLSRLLRSASPMRHRVPSEALVRIDDAEVFLPASIGDYSDFLRRFIMRRTQASSSDLIIRCFRTTNTCRLLITVALLRLL